jgi:hypothetical protein
MTCIQCDALRGAPAFRKFLSRKEERDNTATQPGSVGGQERTHVRSLDSFAGRLRSWLTCSSEIFSSYAS